MEEKNTIKGIVIMIVTIIVNMTREFVSELMMFTSWPVDVDPLATEERRRAFR